MTYLPDSNWIKKPYVDSKENHRSKTPSLFKQGAIKYPKIRNSFFLILILLACSQVGFGQADGDFGTMMSGNFSTAIWGIYDANLSLNGTTSVPSSKKNAYILNGNVVTLDGTFGFKNLTVLSGGTLNTDAYGINLSGSLYIYGNVNIGVLGSIIVGGSSTLGNSYSGLLTLKPGATFDVTGTLTLGRPKCLLIESNVSYTAQCIFTDISTTNNGTAKVERFMSLSDNWHVYSSPIVGQSIHDFLQYNVDIPDFYEGTVYSGSGMREYYTNPGKWSGNFMYGGLPTGDVVSGKGYSIRTYNDTQSLGTVDATGVPTSSDVSISLTPASSTVNGWNCIGNPYTSSISTSSFLNTTNTSKLEINYKCIYLWDSASGNYRASNIVTKIDDVQLGQGFFVKSNSTSGNTVTFTSDMTSSSRNATFKVAKIIWPSIYLSITNKSLNSFTDIMLVTNTTKGLDPGYDAGLLTATPEFSLYSRLLEDNGVNFMLQCLPDQSIDYVIPLGLDCKIAGDVTFTAVTVNLPSGCQALLEDRLTKRFARLDLKDAKYTATVSADTKGTGRFFLHTSDVISGVQPLENQPYKITTINNIVTITGEVSEAAQFYLYSINGKQLANFKAESLVQTQFDASGYPAGVYILTVVDKNQRKSVKFVIEK